jgi:hypothetical protein
MRSELRDKVAELLMEAMRHRERSLLVFWLRAYCQMAGGRDSPQVPFVRWARFVERHRTELRWCGDPGEAWGRSLVSASGLFHSGDGEQVAIAPQYRKELPLVCARAAAYWEFLKELHHRSYPSELPGVLQQAALLWRHRLFFEFHELLEGIWMDWRGPERRFLQGLIQLGVAFYHVERNNYRGAMSMFRSGWAKVAPHTPSYCGVELQGFLKRIAACRERVERLGPGRLLAFDWSSVPPLQVAGERRAAVAGSTRQGH